jgi:aminoglycoside phosphotransferase (APT) family kinase protein
MPGLELDESRAHALVSQACAQAAVTADHARLVRLGSNAVFRLAGPVVARVSRSGTAVDQAGRTVSVARWLETVDYPAVRLAEVAAEQPIMVDGHAVTFWQAVSEDGDEYATVAELADVLGQLHALTAPAGLRLPRVSPFDSAESRIADSRWLRQEDRTFLTGLLTRLRESYARLDFVLPEGVIHGDANVGNVLHDFRGKPVVIDLDGFSIGPREWDLALTAIYFDSFGWHTREEYETFARVYGFDIMKWPGYPVMRAVREFLMVTWVVQKAIESERLAEEARKRIAALRTGASRKDWQPL